VARPRSKPIDFFELAPAPSLSEYYWLSVFRLANFPNKWILLSASTCGLFPVLKLLAPMKNFT